MSFWRSQLIKLLGRVDALEDLGLPPFVTSRAGLKAVDTRKNTTAMVGGLIPFAWDASDLSGIVLPFSFTTTSADTGTDTFSLRSATTTSVNGSSDTMTAAAHGFSDGDAVTIASSDWNLASGTAYFIFAKTDDTFKFKLTSTGGRFPLGSTGHTGSATVTIKAIHRLKTGDPVYVTATADLVAQTKYYAICPDIYTFQLATTQANAVAGTAINLTVATNITVRAVSDDAEARHVIKTASPYDGSDGAWVSDDYKAGRTFQLTEFGDITGINANDKAVMRKAVSACNVYATITGAVPILEFPANRSVALDNIRLGNSIHIKHNGCRIIVPFNGAGHATRPGTTERLYECFEEDAAPHVIIEGGAVYGSYDAALSTTTPLSVINLVSCAHAKVDGVAFRECATGSTGLPAIIYERDHSLVRMLNCRRSEVVNCDVRRCAGSVEEVVIMDSNAFGSKVVWCNVAGNKFRDGEASNSAISVITCLGGSVVGNTIIDYQNSATNLVCDNLFIANNVIDGVLDSYGIDTTETGYYCPQNCIITGNEILNCDKSGILAGGNGNFIVGNYIEGCATGINISNALTTQANIEGLFGVGVVTFTETDMSGVYIANNIIRNCTSFGIRVAGDSASGTKTSAVLENNRIGSTSPTALTSAIHLEDVGTVVVRGGTLEDGTSNAIRIAGTNNIVEVDGVIIKYASDTTIGNGIQFSATSLRRLSLRNVHFPDVRNAGHFDVINSAGTINVVSYDGLIVQDAGASRALGVSGLTTTPIFYNGLLRKTETIDFASVPANARGTAVAVTLYGARVGDVVSVSPASVAISAVFVGTVASDNNLNLIPLNVTTSALDPGSTTYNITVAGNMTALMSA